MSWKKRAGCKIPQVKDKIRGDDEEDRVRTRMSRLAVTINFRDCRERETTPIPTTDILRSEELSNGAKSNGTKTIEREEARQAKQIEYLKCSTLNEVYSGR